MQSIALVLLASSLAGPSIAWPQGAPSGACGTLTPNHGASAKQTPSPYFIEAAKVTPGQYQVTVSGQKDGRNTPFMGFIVQASQKSLIIALTCPYCV